MPSYNDNHHELSCLTDQLPIRITLKRLPGPSVHRLAQVDKHDVWLNNMMHTNGAVQDELDRLVNIYLEHDQLTLYCWCAPKRCHAESIMRVVVTIIMEGESIL